MGFLSGVCSDNTHMLCLVNEKGPSVSWGEVFWMKNLNFVQELMEKNRFLLKFSVLKNRKFRRKINFSAERSKISIEKKPAFNRQSPVPVQTS